MRINLCKYFGHKWIPIYVIGWFETKRVKFIGTACKRCGFGKNELSEAVNKMSRLDVNSYGKKYFD